MMNEASHNKSGETGAESRQVLIEGQLFVYNGETYTIIKILTPNELWVRSETGKEKTIKLEDH